MSKQRRNYLPSHFQSDPLIDETCLMLAEDITLLQEWGCLTSLDPSLEVRQEDLLDVVTEGGSLSFLLWSEETVATADAAFKAVRGVERGVATHEHARNAIAESLGRIGQVADQVAASIEDRSTSYFLVQIAERISGYLSWFVDDLVDSKRVSPWLEFQTIQNAEHWLNGFVSMHHASDALQTIPRIHRSLRELSINGAAIAEVQIVTDSGRCLAHLINISLLGENARVANWNLLTHIAQWWANEISAGALCSAIKQCISANDSLPPRSWEAAYTAWSAVWIVVHGKSLGGAFESDLPRTITDDIRSLLARITRVCRYLLD
ncbi:MAG: hypothetical protein AAFX06_22470 [Planctomycetota bacterium]